MAKFRQKVVTLGLTAVLTLSLAACGSSSYNATEMPSEAAQAAEIPSETTPSTTAPSTATPDMANQTEVAQTGINDVASAAVLSPNTPEMSATPIDTTIVTGDFIFNGDQFLLEIGEVDAGSIAISDAETLAKIGNDFNYSMSGKYHLTADIDLSDMNWMPIGGQVNPFSGVFDGQGHIIRGLTITGEVSNSGGGSNINYAGLFGRISDATIKNLGLVDTDIDVTIKKGLVGAIAGGGNQDEDFTISNCYNIGSVSAILISYGGSVGGICGNTFGNVTIDGCYNSGEVYALSKSGGSKVGGISGSGFRLLISNSYNSGDITASGQGTNIGGILGEANNSSIMNCYNSGNIECGDVGGANGGGICGNGTANISNCGNSGSVYCRAVGDVYAGGINGYNAENIENCYNVGNITSISDDNSGFKRKAVVAGISSNSKILNCYNTGSLSVTASDSNSVFLGAICAGETNRGTPINCYWRLESDQTMNGTALTTGKRGVGNADDTTTPISDEELKKSNSFNGFDFVGVWGFKPDENNGNPVLRCFYDTSLLHTQNKMSTVPQY